MPLINLRQIHKSFGTDHLFRDLDMKIFRTEKVGLIGANGTGKTTLFRLILGDTLPDSGEIIQRKGVKVGYLPQEPVFDGKKTIIEEVHSGLESLLQMEKKIEAASVRLGELSGKELETAMAEYDKMCHEFELDGGYEYETRVKMILAGVGITEEHYNTTTEQLSGGQLSRLGLAKVLLSQCDLLLLDEPTNHLDLAATEWLEKFLRSYPGGAVIISHDRYLLDRVAVKIFELEGRKATAWKGNYSQYLDLKKIASLQQQRDLDKRKKMVAKEKDFIERNRNDVGMRKVARGRATRLNKLLEDNPDYLEDNLSTRTLRFKFNKVENLSHNVLKCSSLSKKYDDLLLFENLDFDLQMGDRIGITGPNGTGKSTLLKIALGKVKATSGKIKFGSTLKVGYMDQHAEEMLPENTPIEEIQRIRPDMLVGEIRNKLGAFLFHGDDVFKQVQNLSGGEQNRLMLCRLVLSNPDVLVLDEPTNHLDIGSKEAMENALRDYDGTILVVSHDRYFLDKISNKLLIMGVNQLGKKDTGQYEFISAEKQLYSYYSQILSERAEKAEQQKFASSGGQSKKAGRNRNKERKVAPAEIKQFNKYRVEQIEEMIMETEDSITDLKNKFGLEEYYKDHSKMVTLQNEADEKQAYLDLLYQAYEFKLG